MWRYVVRTFGYCFDGVDSRIYYFKPGWVAGRERWHVIKIHMSCSDVVCNFMSRDDALRFANQWMELHPVG